jgi:hypothetical protein
MSFLVTSFSQTQFTTNVASANEKGIINPTTWQLYFSDGGVEVNYKFQDCDYNSGLDEQNVLLKFTNTTSNTLELKWNIELYYDGVCKTCGNTTEYSRELTIEPGQSLEGVCARETDMRLKIFSKFIDPNYTRGARLSGFQLNSLIISEL